MKRPRLKRIAGRDNSTNSGFKSVLTIEKINPAKRKPQKPAVESTFARPRESKATDSHKPNELRIHRTTKIKTCCPITTLDYIINRSTIGRSGSRNQFR